MSVSSDSRWRWRRLRPPQRWLVAVLVLALAGGAALSWRLLTDPTTNAREAAQRAARALADRDLTDGAFGTSAEQAQRDDLAVTLRGMGDLRPTITVESVQVADDQRTATARLQAEWVIHAGKPSWIQVAYLRLVRGADGWTALWGRELIASGLADGERLRAVRLAPQRGEIIGADDERLVWNQDAKRIGLDKTLVAADRQSAAAGRLARAVGIDPAQYRAKVAAYGPRAWVEAAVVRAVGNDEWKTLSKVTDLPGVRVFDAVRPLAVSSTFARAVLGSVGEATAEIINTSNGAIRQGDLVGLGGLQRVLNPRLTGTTGFEVQAYPDGDLAAARPLFTVPAVGGESVRVSIDGPRQRLAEKLIDGRPGRAAVVEVRASDGALVSVASRPGSTAATTQRVYPVDFPPVTQVESDRSDGLEGTLAKLGLTTDPELGIELFLASADAGTVRLSPLGLATATATVATGGPVVPFLVVDKAAPAVRGGVTPDQVRQAQRSMRRQASALGLGERDLAAGGVDWTVVGRGDRVVAVYDPDGDSLAIARRMLRG